VLLSDELAAGKVVAAVPGGETRALSVAAGLDVVADDAEAILVHDAARPFATAELIDRLLEALATHAGDALFEVCYQPEFAQCARSLRDDYDGSYEKFWEDFRSRPAYSKESDQWLVNAYCMAAVLLVGRASLRHGDRRAKRWAIGGTPGGDRRRTLDASSRWPARASRS